MRAIFIGLSVMLCLGLTKADQNPEYQKYDILVKDIPSAQILILQNKSLDITIEELNKIEAKLDSVND